MFTTFSLIDPIYFSTTLFYLAGLLTFLFRQGKISFYLVLIGFGIHTFFLWNRAWLLGFFSPIALFEGIYFLPWCLALVRLSFPYFSKNKTLLDSSVGLLLISSLVPFFFPLGIVPPFPKSQTPFAGLFFFFEGLAQAGFILGAWAGFLFLKEKEGATVFHFFNIWGFVFYSIAQVVGAYWSFLGWATPIHWGSRHLQSAALWCFYAALLHCRYLPDWTMKQEARLSLIGFLLILLFFYGGHFREITLPRITG
ncbi:MAG: cytochrome c biogenesis protein CcsA [Pseudomonadota bacterium]